MQSARNRGDLDEYKKILTEEQIAWAINIYKSSYNVQEIAEACYVSTKTMRRYFKEYIGDNSQKREKNKLIVPWR